VLPNDAWLRMHADIPPIPIQTRDSKLGILLGFAEKDNVSACCSCQGLLIENTAIC